MIPAICKNTTHSNIGNNCPLYLQDIKGINPDTNCSRVFERTEHFDVGHKHAETEQPQDNKARRFQCEQCGIRYARREKLRQHLQNKHDVTMPVHYQQQSSGRFACDICGQKFTKSGSVLQHKKRKHKNLG